MPVVTRNKRRRMNPRGKRGAARNKDQEDPSHETPPETREIPSETQQTSSEPQEIQPEPQEKPSEKSGVEKFMKVYTDFFVAPPTGYENVDIEGLEKFYLLGNHLIPYDDWISSGGDVRRLSGEYSVVPPQILKSLLESAARDSGELNRVTNTTNGTSDNNTPVLQMVDENVFHNSFLSHDS